MPLARFQKVAVAALCSLLLLIVAGAVVRVSGAGMGCPDWPTCWGCLVPPTKVEDVDFSKLKIQKFKDKAAREGRDPDTITSETLRAEFNPRLAWTEYLNRLCTTPLSVFTLATFILSFWQRRQRPSVFWAAFLSLLLIGVNAWMGARIVYSGLKPGIITTHLALAMAMFGLLAWCAWRGTDRPWRADIAQAAAGKLKWGLVLLLGVVIAEGILGAQIREITDEMAKAHHAAPKEQWIGELERQWIYLIHRSFSWVVLVVTLWLYLIAARHGNPGRVGKAVLGIVLAQMVLGVVMSQVHLYAGVQVLHVVLAAVLLVFNWLWLFGAWEVGTHREGWWGERPLV
ncbi:COX15/CtaA family protein [Luteolibacter ambystomatis]|uniref:COX15/CtaA family protein n=1 Tax=Luteolibacter ambystomatis TaxID=2824561 RepID=A0A975PGM3_9BACT|nr:COX15/CtaA family protein [Luteolibacter ambystomatis]QUE52720.1 COX15/CtaA family protein [Luteolibacter ambystomatis]